MSEVTPATAERKYTMELCEKVKNTVCGSHENPDTWIYKRSDNGIYVHEVCIDSGKGGNPVKIMHATDIHFNYVNEKDHENDEVMLTVRHRFWNANGASVIVAKKLMEYGKNFNRIVITGDVLDYLSYGAMELMDKYIWNKDPGVIVSVGGHEFVRQMQTSVNDKTPLEERYKIVADYWRHDIYYTSEIIDDKVMIVQLDNSRHKYIQQQVEKLESDILLARKNGYVMLVFQHEPICTGNPQDTNVQAVRVYDGEFYNFYDNCVGSASCDDVTAKAYALLTENADVIKGFFCGHLHSCYFTEIKGCYKDETGTLHKVIIPQYVLEGAVYDDYAGHITDITIK